MCRDVTTSSTKWIDNAQLQTGMIAMRLRRGNLLNAAPEMQLLFRNKGRIGDSQTFEKKCNSITSIIASAVQA